MSNEITNYMKREEHATLSVVQHLDIGEYENPLLLVAPQGGVTLLRFHIVAPVNLPVVGVNYFEFDLAIYACCGTQLKWIHLESCNTSQLPFGAHTRITWPPVGRFDEVMEEGQTIHGEIETFGNPTGRLGMQLDYMLAGR